MNLLENAVESIKVGVEDYEAGTHSRLLAAVRNIHAGIVLLCKEKLRRLSPPGSNDVLMMRDNRPTRDAQGNVLIVGHGKKTVDVWQIEERFQSLGIPLDTKRLDRITDARNEIEHHYPKATKAALDGVVADAFLVARGLIEWQLGSDPRELLGEEVWQTMLDVSEVHEAERKDCEKNLEAVDWQSSALESGVHELQCDKCGSDLLRAEPSPGIYNDLTQLICRSCGARQDASDYVPKAVAEALAGDNYVSVKDGGGEVYTDCPECCLEAYVLEEGGCAYCGHAAEHECARCGSKIPPEELVSSPLCGYCDHMMSKDD
jgi:hypothetical protein